MEWVNKTNVKISKHSYFRRAHKNFFHYIKHELSMQIDVEPGDILMIDIPAKMKWLHPDEDVRVPADEREQIIHEIKKALKFMRLKYEIIEEE